MRVFLGCSFFSIARSVSCVFAGLVCLFSAHAQEPPLTLSAAIEQALKVSETIEQARTRMEIAEAQIRGALAGALPNLSGALSATTLKDSVDGGNALFGGDAYNAYSAELAATQALFDGGAIYFAFRAGRLEREIRKVELGIASRDVEVHTIDLFYRALLAQSRVATINRLLGIQQRLQRTAQERYRIGNEQALSVLQIKTSVSLLLPRQSRAVAELQTALQDLAFALNLEPARVERVRASLKISTNLNAGLLKSRIGTEAGLKLQRSELLAEQMYERRRYQLAAHWPKLSAQASVGRAAFEREKLFDANTQSWSLGLSLSVPLFSGLSSFAERREYAERTKELELGAARERRELAVERKKAWVELSSAEDVLRASEEALTTAGEAVRVAERTYRLGTATYLQVAEVQRQLADAEFALEEAQQNRVLKLARFYYINEIDFSELIKILDTQG